MIRNYFYLTIKNDNVVVEYEDSCKKEITRTFENIDDYAIFFSTIAKEAEVEFDDLIIMCSSSLDWPEDSTDNIETIKLADAIRGNNVAEGMG
jgi:hypothetical protein